MGLLLWSVVSCSILYAWRRGGTTWLCPSKWNDFSPSKVKINGFLLFFLSNNRSRLLMVLLIWSTGGWAWVEFCLGWSSRLSSSPMPWTGSFSTMDTRRTAWVTLSHSPLTRATWNSQWTSAPARPSLGNGNGGSHTSPSLGRSSIVTLLCSAYVEGYVSAINSSVSNHFPVTPYSLV